MSEIFPHWCNMLSLIHIWYKTKVTEQAYGISDMGIARDKEEDNKRLLPEHTTKIGIN